MGPVDPVVPVLPVVPVGPVSPSGPIKATGFVVSHIAALAPTLVTVN